MIGPQIKPVILDTNPLVKAFQNMEMQRQMDIKNARQDELLRMQKTQFEAEQKLQPLRLQQMQQGIEGQRFQMDQRRQLAPGQLALQGLQVQNARNAADPTYGPNQRAKIAEQYGLKPDDPRFLNYVVNGQIPNQQTPYGKQGQVFQGQDGKYYSVQFGANGQRLIMPLDGLTPDRGIATVDTGTGTRVINNTTGGDVREISRDLVGAARAKAIGRAQGDTIANFPKARAQFAMAEQKWSRVQPSIDRARQLIRSNPMVVGLVGTAAARIPGSAAYRLSQYLDTIKANIGFSELQAMRDASPTGGALGQVSEFENRLLQAVQGSLQQGLDAPTLLQMLNDVQTNLGAVRKITSDAFNSTYGDMMKGDGQAQQNPPTSGFRIRRMD